MTAGLPMALRDGRIIVTGTPEFEAEAAKRLRVVPLPEPEAEVDFWPEDARTALERAGARPLGDIDRSAPRPLINGRISPNGHTMLFGPGDAGKGLLTAAWISQHVEDRGRVLIVDFEDHPEEWSRRIFGLGGADMFEGTPIRHVSPLRHGRPDWRVLAEAAGEHGATLVVIDSVAYAVPGADPSDPQAATAYSAAIQPFGVPVL